MIGNSNVSLGLTRSEIARGGMRGMAWTSVSQSRGWPSLVARVVCLAAWIRNGGGFLAGIGLKALTRVDYIGIIAGGAFDGGARSERQWV